MSILVISIMASKARLAAALFGSEMAAVSARGVICHDRPHWSLHQPQALGCLSGSADVPRPGDC
jgi:hypothetical protein